MKMKTQQNFCDKLKVVLQGKFVALSAIVSKQKNFKNQKKQR